MSHKQSHFLRRFTRHFLSSKTNKKIGRNLLSWPYLKRWMSDRFSLGVAALAATPGDSFWWPEARCRQCSVMVGGGGWGSFPFLEISCQKLGTPLPALGLLQQSYERFVYSTCATRSNVRVSWRLLLLHESSRELSGTSHSISFKPWSCHWLFIFLSRKWPKSFPCFCCSGVPWVVPAGAQHSQRGWSDGAHLQPAPMGVEAANPALWEQHFVHCWVIGLWQVFQHLKLSK